MDNTTNTGSERDTANTDFNLNEQASDTTSSDVPPQFAHIKGWGVDADPHNDPTYPMKRWNGRDHQHSNYKRPTQQIAKVEILKTVEKKHLSATFGTSAPPAGLSGMIRRWAFKYSEDSYKHWVPLIIADRVDAVEGVFDDLVHGHIPNLFAEHGWNAQWKYNRKSFLIKVAAGVLITSTAVMIMTGQDKKLKKRLS